MRRGLLQWKKFRMGLMNEGERQEIDLLSWDGPGLVALDTWEEAVQFLIRREVVELWEPMMARPPSEFIKGINYLADMKYIPNVKLPEGDEDAAHDWHQVAYKLRYQPHGFSEEEEKKIYKAVSKFNGFPATGVDDVEAGLPAPARKSTDRAAVENQLQEWDRQIADWQRAHPEERKTAFQVAQVLGFYKEREKMLRLRRDLIAKKKAEAEEPVEEESWEALPFEPVTIGYWVERAELTDSGLYEIVSTVGSEDTYDDVDDAVKRILDFFKTPQAEIAFPDADEAHPPSAWKAQVMVFGNGTVTTITYQRRLSSLSEDDWKLFIRKLKVGAT